MGLTATKRGRLAIIIAVGVVIVAALLTFDLVTTSNADDDAHDFARAAYDQLRTIEHDDVDQLAADALTAEWAGDFDDSAFLVDDLVPEVITDVADGKLARYRIRSSGTERCVDALWPDDGPFVVAVNRCQSYERP